VSIEILDLQLFQNQPLTTEPFPFMVLEDFLHNEQTKLLVQDFPKITGAGLFPVQALKLGSSMQKLVDELSSEAFRKAVGLKFGIDLTGCPPMVTFRGYAQHKDGRIHADSESKLVSLLLYLNEDWSSDEGGNLRFLRDPADIESTIVEIPAKAGTLAIFKVTRNCWHGHHKFVGERRVLMVNYMVNEAAWQKETKRHQFSARIKSLKRMVGMV
jgi:hypothetical protein